MFMTFNMIDALQTPCNAMQRRPQVLGKDMGESHDLRSLELSNLSGLAAASIHTPNLPTKIIPAKIA